jgi:hypothetical protein
MNALAEPAVTTRYFVTYSGIRPPARLVEPLTEADLLNRNTFIRAHYDAEDRLLGFEKMVYGAVELAHAYTWHANGRLETARIAMDGEESLLAFDADGRPIAD